MATEISAPEPVAQETAPAKTLAKKAASKKRASTKPKRKKPVAKKRTSKKAAKKPIALKKSVAKKSVAKKSAARKSAPKKRKAKKKKPVVVSKAQSIRDMAKTLGRKARPRDIIAALAEKGITVASAQVSITLTAAGLRKGRRRKKVVAAKPSANGHAFLLDELVKVKKLVDELGGTAKLKDLAAALERLA